MVGVGVPAGDCRGPQPESSSLNALARQRPAAARWEMAPSSKADKDHKQKQRKHKEHVVKLLTRGKVGLVRLMRSASMDMKSTSISMFSSPGCLPGLAVSC